VMEGREAATRGEDLAALYLGSELKKIGATYLPEIGNYYQSIDIIVTKFDTSSRITLRDTNGDKLMTLKCLTDFVGSSRYYPPMDTVMNIVFVGYGIDAEEYNYNDYDTVDVTGKIALVWPGEPVSDDSAYFDGPKDSKYSGLYTKISTARDKGAAAIFLVSKMENIYGWDRIVDYTRKGGIKLKTSIGAEKKRRKTLPNITLKTSTFEKLFSYAPATYGQIEEIISTGGEIPKFEFQVESAIDWKFISDSTRQVKNVIGLVEGNDPILKNEFVGIGSHYDHVGVSMAGVYNGADDDGSGTVAVLEVAKAMAFNNKNKRSVLFLFHTAEEKGLLGSKYAAAPLSLAVEIFVYNPLYFESFGPSK